MKTLFLLVLLGGFTLAASAADPVVGRLPDGGYYFKHETDFALKEPVARALSPADATRRAVPRARLNALHPAIREVVGGHTAAEKWLKGEPLPAHLLKNGPEVPRMARSLKAKLHETHDAAKVVEELRQHPDVEWASLNRLRRPALVPSDARWSDQWGPSRVRADDAWDISPASTTRRVAVIDTGVDLVHPDLSARIVYNRGFGGNANGDAKRDRRGGNSIDHGTHVAGIAAAIRNTIGIAGIARANIMAMGCASWNASENEYFICCAADALNDAIANNADAINCSFGNSTLEASESSALDDAQDNGILVVVAAGNDGMDVDSSPSAGWNDHSWPLIVSNIQQDDTRQPSSNFGSAIDLAAPGTSILSTVTTNYNAADPNGTYNYMGGTSMAAPCVAGGAVMVKSMNPSLMSGSGIKHFLYRMAEDLGPAGKDDDYGNGMLQLNPDFLQVLKDADGFLNPSGLPVPLSTGSYSNPYRNLAEALAFEAAGSTLVLNGGTVTYSTYRYPGAITITKACTLKVFPDHVAVVGK